MALMSGDFTENDVVRAKSIGLMLFRKPFGITEILELVFPPFSGHTEELTV
jgi:hypothetical protein